MILEVELGRLVTGRTYLKTIKEIPMIRKAYDNYEPSWMLLIDKG
jgi:hypothetical protein